MQRTVWARLAMRGRTRIVVHTFGSEFDTVLAVYRGTTIPTLARVTGNDNRAVPGVGATHSLVQFDAAKNVPYSIQFGSKTGAEGDVLANVFAFPPMGGLAVFPTSVAGPNLGDFICGYRSEAPACGARQFIVYNSTDQTLVITATHNLGAGVTAPGQVTLAPRALTTMTFEFTASFDQTTARTVVGYFAFTGRVGGVAFATAKSRAIVIVKPVGPIPDTLRAVVIPQVRAGPLSEPIPLEVRATNIGSQAAIGCHVHRSPFNPTRASWQRIDPVTKEALAGQYVPATIPPGQTFTFFVLATSRESRIADATFVGTTQPFTIDCANTNSAPITLANSFDITVRGGYDPARVKSATLAPAGGVLDVPAAGAGFRVQAVNLGPAATLIARPSYERPFAECCDATKQFTVKVCRTNAAGACITAEFDTIQFSAAVGVTNRFKVIVRPPTVDPGYAPGLRRVFLTFAQVQPIGFVHSVPVAAQSIAVRKN